MNTKPWYTSKTIWVAIIQAVVGVMVVLQGQYPGWGDLVVASSVLNFLLRYVTTTAIGS